ncbi:MAG: DUF4410 domain-containing protein [Rhodospirillales bacterium]|nr:DUF4410 domain-containing protein [Rhodospirillales bacterium]
MATIRGSARSEWGSVGAIAFVSLLLLSCSTDVIVTLVKPPPVAPTQLILSEIEARDPEARRLARFMRDALLDRLLRAGAFMVIYDRDGRAADRNALVLEGVLTQADAGSEALRFIVGSGFGRPHLAAAFRVLDREGVARAAFTAVSNERGPTGISGHWRPLSMEDMARALGRTAADAVVLWSKEKRLSTAGMF